MATKMQYRKSAKEIELEQKVSVQKIFDDIIVPEIPSYYAVYPVNFEVGTPVACCPLHDEDTPSLRYYADTNSWYCFGCGKGGNVVRLYRLFYNRMKDTNITTHEAVDYLYKRFIEGKEVKKLDSADKKEVLTNNPVDVVRFNKYRMDTEELLSFDKSITLEQKKKIWELLDNLDTLLSKNILEVNDAMKYSREQIDIIVKQGV